MAKKSNKIHLAMAVAAITQLGLSVIIPIIFCIYITGWLQRKFSPGNWILILGIIVGVISGFYSMISLLRLILDKINRQNDDRD
jgi:ATP synthase protein I